VIAFKAKDIVLESRTWTRVRLSPGFWDLDLDLDSRPMDLNFDLRLSDLDLDSDLTHLALILGIFLHKQLLKTLI